MSRRVAGFLVLGIMISLSGCMRKTDNFKPLAPDISAWVSERGTTSCANLEPRYRIAQGVRAALKVPAYKAAVLQELSGPGRPPMDHAKAISFSARSARLLRGEMDRRCPDHKVKGREAIVYIPQGV